MAEERARKVQCRQRHETSERRHWLVVRRLGNATDGVNGIDWSHGHELWTMHAHRSINPNLGLALGRVHKVERPITSSRSACSRIGKIYQKWNWLLDPNYEGRFESLAST